MMLVNTAALELDGKGCTRTGIIHSFPCKCCLIESFPDKHSEDKNFSAALAQFPIQQPTTVEDNKESELEEVPLEPTPVVVEERDGYFIHPVSTNETLVGIALKYQTTVRILIPHATLFFPRVILSPLSFPDSGVTQDQSIDNRQPTVW